MSEIERMIQNYINPGKHNYVELDGKLLVPNLAKELEQYVIRAEAKAVDEFADKCLIGEPLEKAIEYVAQLKSLKIKETNG